MAGDFRKTENQDIKSVKSVKIRANLPHEQSEGENPLRSFFIGLRLTNSYMKKICVIGAGTMGNGIAHVFAQNGFDVSLVDVSQEQLNKALSTITKNLDRQVTKGVIPADHKEATLERIETNTSLASGVKDADLIVEAAT